MIIIGIILVPKIKRWPKLDVSKWLKIHWAAVFDFVDIIDGFWYGRSERK